MDFGADFEFDAAVLGLARPAFTTVSVYRGRSYPELTHPDVADDMEIVTPFQMGSWLASIAHAASLQKGVEPVTVVCRHRGEAVLTLPLVLDTRGRLRKLTWLGQDISDYGGPLGQAGALRALSPISAAKLLQRLGDALGGVDLVVLEKQRAAYGIVPNPFVSEASVRYHVASHRTSLAADWDTYYGAKRGARTRSRLRSKLSSLGKLGRVELKFSHEPDEAEELVHASLDMKAKQLARKRHSNPFSGMESRNRLAQVFGRGCNKDTWVASLSLDGRPLAVSFGFCRRSSWLLYQIAMEPGAYDAYSPGAQLIGFILKQCCTTGVEKFDFSLGDESYKFDWCETSEDLYSTYMALSLRGAFAVLALRAAASARLATTVNPWLHEKAKILKGVLGQRRSKDMWQQRHGLRISIVAPEGLPSMIAAWRSLAANAIEDNAYYAPPYAQALLEPIAAGGRVLCVTVWSGDKLVAFLPVEKAVGPISSWRAWQTLFNFSSTPLLSRDCAQQAAAALLEGLSELCKGEWHMPNLNIEGAAANALKAALGQRSAPHRTLRLFNRAILHKGTGYEEHLARHIDKDLRKSLARRRRRLEEMGEVAHISATEGKALADAVEAFLELETSGWKGRRGTALGSSEAGKAFARRAFKADESGTARADLLCLDGRPIAAMLTVFSGSTGFTVKAAYDEVFARHSPAQLLELDILKSFLTGGWATSLDSGTDGAHVVDQFWPDRIKVGSLLFSLAERSAASRLSLAAFQLNLWLGARGAIKTLLRLVRK